MKIKRIELYNFRQYKDKQVIDFSCDDTKNVTILIGENTSGKTTFVRAFEWCLYDNLAWQDTPTRWKDDNLLNLEVASKMIVNNSEKVYVMLEILDDNGNEYQIKRSQEYVCNANKINSRPSKVEVWKKNEIGEFKPTPIKDNDATIRDFLPVEFAKFFFFGGERLATITDDTNLSKYIKTLTGLSNLEKASVYLDDVIKTFKRKIHKNPNAEQYEKEIENLQSEIDSSTLQLNNAIEQLNYYENEVNNLKQILKDNQKTKEKQISREKLENNLEQQKEKLQKDKKDFIRYFNNNASVYFSQPLIKQVESVLMNYLNSKEKEKEKENLPKNNIPYISKDIFNYIMQNKVCLCGANLEENPKALEHLNELMGKINYKPPVDRLEKSVNIYRNYIQSKYFDFYDNFKLKYDNILETNKKIDEIEDELSEITNFLQSAKDLKKVEEDLEQKSKQKEEWGTKKYNLQHKLDNNKEKIKELENKITLSIENTEFNKKQQTYIAYAQNTKDWICKSLDKRTIEVKTTLQDKINGTFQKMYHGNRQIQIGEGSDEYKVVYTGGYLEESDGLKAVKNFAFIVGLIELAKQKLSDTEDLQRHFPLVMDAPFSNVDEIHISNICDIIPTSASQVIISVMDKDWEVARKNLERYVGKSYMIVKSVGDDGRKKETITTIKEV